MTPGPRQPPQDGSQMRVVRKPNLRVRQGVRDNNVPLLNRLQHKVDLRNTDKNRLTSLSWAALEGSLEVFEWLLLDYGHDDQELSRDADNNTILHLLASIPSPPTHSPHTHLLLSSPSFPPRPSTKSLAVQISTSLRMTHLYHTLFPFLLDWSNSGGKTALHVAAQAGNTAFINLLCDVGADVDLTDLQGNTPLHYASAWGHVETIRVLLERGCQFGARNFEGFTASDFAYSATVMGSIQTIARELLEERRNRRKAEAESYSNPPQGRLRSGSASTNLSNGSGLSANMVSPTGGVAAVDRRLGIMTSEGDLERPANSYFSNRLGNGRDPNHSPGGPSPTSASPNLQPGSLAPGGFSMRRGDSAQTGSESSYSQAPPNKRMASAPGGRGTPI